jgi:hypothetical protein
MYIIQLIYTLSRSPTLTSKLFRYVFRPWGREIKVGRKTRNIILRIIFIIMRRFEDQDQGQAHLTFTTLSSTRAMIIIHLILILKNYTNKSS